MKSLPSSSSQRKPKLILDEPKTLWCCSVWIYIRISVCEGERGEREQSWSPLLQKSSILKTSYATSSYGCALYWFFFPEKGGMFVNIVITISSPLSIQTENSEGEKKENSPFQRVNCLLHYLPPHTQNLHSHLFHPLLQPHNPNFRIRARAGCEFTHPGGLEADFGVVSSGVGTSACGKDGGFAGG